MRSTLQQTAAGSEPCTGGAGWLREAMAAAGACVWCWDEERGALSWEGATAELLPEVPASLDGLDALVAEPDREPRRAALTRALQRGDAWACIFRLAGPGEARWIEERGRAAPGPGGARATALLVDVTLRREAQRALEQRLLSEARERQAAQVATGTAEAALRALARSEAYLESIFASMADGLILFAPDGRISRINPTARQMLGFGDAEAAMTSAERMTSRLRLLDGDGKEVPYEDLPVVTALRGESVRGRSYCLDLVDGRKVWTVCSAAPIRAPDGGIAGAVLTLGDVTRLREVQEQREDLSRMISHDLRTPLGIILAQAKLIGRRNEGPDAVRTRAEAIATSAQRMAGMLNDLVDSALLEAGKLHLERQPVDLTAMAQDLRRRLAAPYDGERMRVEAGPGVPRVSADPNRLERVLVNLFTNALKYSEAGSEVVVRVLGAPGEAVLEVEDRGPGIRSEDLPHLFERYFRALNHGRFEGMGLGLYTARRLIEAHGGTIAVTSVPGHGSTFRVRLPAAV